MFRSKQLAVLLLFTYLLASAESFSQQQRKAQLQREKKENLFKAAQAKKILQQTEAKKKISIGQLKALNQQIEASKALMTSISEELHIIDREVKELSELIQALKSDLAHLKNEYREMIYDAYKASQGYSKITFLFSAKTFNQLFLRLKYMEQYTQARKAQVTLINQVAEELQIQRTHLAVKRKEKNQLLQDKRKENQNLLRLKEKQDAIIRQLSQKEQQLKAELEERKEAVAKLDQLITKIIKAEVARSKTEKNAEDSEETFRHLTTHFEQKKSKLSWPVSSGFVSGKFGKHPHPVLKSIEIENQGIDIQTTKGAPVKSVFEGTVTATAFVPGMNRVVIVKHGDYYTLYAKLKSVNVKKGQSVNAQETLGKVHTDKDGISEIQFQVWKKQRRVDPEHWLMSR